MLLYCVSKYIYFFHKHLTCDQAMLAYYIKTFLDVMSCKFCVTIKTLLKTSQKRSESADP